MSTPAPVGFLQASPIKAYSAIYQSWLQYYAFTSLWHISSVTLILLRSVANRGGGWPVVAGCVFVAFCLFAWIEFLLRFCCVFLTARFCGLSKKLFFYLIPLETILQIYIHANKQNRNNQKRKDYNIFA